jgi:hypothetical protein
MVNITRILCPVDLSECSRDALRHASLGPLPIQVVALVNDELSRHYGSGRYATMFFAEYDTSERLLRYVNAGQNPPRLRDGTWRCQLGADSRNAGGSDMERRPVNKGTT